MRTSRSSLAGVAVAALLLNLTATAVLAQDDTGTPDVPVGEGTAYFTGTEACTSEMLGSAVADGVQRAEIHYTCETVTTDPRFSGTEEIDLVAYDGGTAGGPWTAEGALTRDEGSWRGQGLGVWDAGASPLAPGVPFNYGEMTYIGEGAYEGLVLHYYVAGTDQELALMGWITPSE